MRLRSHLLLALALVFVAFGSVPAWAAAACSASTTGTDACDDDGDCYCDDGAICAGSTDTSCTLQTADDCDDTDDTVSPAATEVVGDGVDQNCNGRETCYDDDDDDGQLDAAGDTRSSLDTDCADSKEGTSTDPTTDCDDTDATIYDGATETTGDGVDSDCDGGEICYDDDDDDGQLDTSGDTRVSTDEDCTDTYEALSSAATTDCDDTDAASYDGATEITGDGIDENCNGRETCYDDDDDDGQLDTTGDTRSSSDSDCDDAKEGLSTDATTDCDDSDPTIYSGATEVVSDQIDQSCDGKESCWDDDDNDGQLDSTGDTRTSSDTDCTDSYEGLNSDATTDCDDASATVYTGATEITGDEIDQSCDGTEVCYDDDDNDGQLDTAGDTRSSTDTDCDDSYEGSSSDATTDCDDNDSSDYLGATETVGNGDDESCDGKETCYDDDDDDGELDTSGDTRVSTDTDCNDTYEGLGSDPTTDCDDSDASLNSDGTETVGDGVDGNCDGVETCYGDLDDDGQLDSTGGTRVSADEDCDDAYEGTSTDATTDCDDSDPLVYAGAEEICDGQYDDCDDADYSAYSAPDDEIDDDGDQYVECSDFDISLWDGDSDVVGGDDCDDEDEDLYPNATEICDGRYNDCDDPDFSTAGVPSTEGDQDGDLYVACVYDAEDWKLDELFTPEGGGDCDDFDADVYPGANEICDGQYNDCDDTSYDDSSAPEEETDDDGDLYVECDDFLATSWVGDPLIIDGDDCNDEDDTVYTDATEICDGQYNDCGNRHYDEEGAPDDELDEDEDGYVGCTTRSSISWAGTTEPTGGDDCDDDNNYRYPGAPEACDGEYDDCDDPRLVYDPTGAPDDEIDDDGDDYIDCAYSAALWTGYDVTVIGGDDCDDDDDTVYPTAQEVCDGQYNDCDDSAYTDEDAPEDEWDDDGDTFVECVRYSSIAWQPWDGVTDTPNAESWCENNRACYDCDDDSATTFPGAAGLEDTLLCMADADDDGYGDLYAEGDVTAGTDCDDDDELTWPGAAEVCESGDQVDNDCNGDVNTQTDPETGEVTTVAEGDGIAVYVDADGDGFGDPDQATDICEEGLGFSLLGTDCDDTDANVYPNAVELCNDQDDDCDLEADESDDVDPEISGCVDMYRDLDGDDFGNYDDSACLCVLTDDTWVEDRGDRYSRWGGDCDDSDSSVHPLTCEDGIDNDGDDQTDSDDPDCAAGLDEMGTEVETHLETLDGNDNDCDGLIAAIELDCDDDGSLVALPNGAIVGEVADDFGLASCTDGGLDSRSIACWDETAITLECDDDDDTDPTTGTGLWVLRYGESDDGWGGRYENGRRVYTADTSCESTGDCDDQCASRCPGATETCDGVDNDCSGTDPGDYGEDDLPVGLTGEEVVSGTISDTELDLDGDGYYDCESFDDDDEQVQTSDNVCSDALGEVEQDCNNTCVLATPDASERCDGFLDLCDGEAEGTDADGDVYRTCGAWSGDEGEAVEEDIYVVVWVRPDLSLDALESVDGWNGTFLDDTGTGDTGSASGDTGTGDTGTASGDTGTASGDTGARRPAAPAETGSIADSARVIPLLLPRAAAADCDETLQTQLAAALGAEALATAMSNEDPLALLDLCAEGPFDWNCGIVRLTLDRDADEAMRAADGAWDIANRAGLISKDCKANPQQTLTRAVWSRDRVLEARRVVVESECRRLYGTSCASLETPMPLSDSDRELVNPTVALSYEARWWSELGRYEPEAITDGTLLSCWGEPSWVGGGDDDEAPELDDQWTGGDCADSVEGANRDQPEGPADLLARYQLQAGTLDELPDCSLCLDGIDNNCDGDADCADASCAPCFVGAGAGCGGGSDEPCSSAGCAVSGRNVDERVRFGWIASVLVALWWRRRGHLRG